MGDLPLDTGKFTSLEPRIGVGRLSHYLCKHVVIISIPFVRLVPALGSGLGVAVSTRTVFADGVREPGLGETRCLP